MWIVDFRDATGKGIREVEKTWHQKLALTAEMKADLTRPKSEIVEKIEGSDGGPCRGRTYGPLIKRTFPLETA